MVSADGNKFEKNLQFEIKLHNCLRNKGVCILENLAKYEKKLGVESTDKEIFVMNEMVDSSKYISLSELIQNVGGLLRIPFLTKTNAVSYIIK